MITNSKQNWEVGSQVKVGFLTLTVTAKKPTPGDYAPDAYHLQDAKGRQGRSRLRRHRNPVPRQDAGGRRGFLLPAAVRVCQSRGGAGGR